MLNKLCFKCLHLLVQGYKSVGCQELGYTAGGERAKLHLYLQLLPITCITAWAPPLLRSAAAFASHRSMNRTVNYTFKGPKLNTPYENLMPASISNILSLLSRVFCSDSNQNEITEQTGHKQYTPNGTLYLQEYKLRALTDSALKCVEIIPKPFTTPSLWKKSCTKLVLGAKLLGYRFKANISFLSFCLCNISIDVIEVLKPHTPIVLGWGQLTLFPLSVFSSLRLPDPLPQRG